VVVADAEQRHQLGGAVAVRRSSSAVRALISRLRAWWRRPRVPSASLAAASGLVIGPGTRAAAAATRVAAGRSRSCSRRSAGAVTTSALRALLAWGRARIAVGRATRSTRIISTCPVPALGHGGLAGLDRAGGRLGIGRVGLAAAVAGLAVGSVDLHHDLAAVARKRARAAPEEPVPSTPQAMGWPSPRAQASRSW
jgi:hypothetical protein